MRKAIYIFAISLLLITNAKAESEDIESTRHQISNSLNTIVKDLKQYFSSTDRSLNTNLKNIKELEKDITSLVESSSKGESNPTVLDHGKADIEKLKNCNYDSQNIRWTGSEWDCQNVNILVDCNAASDEYRVKQPDGSYRCQKNSPGTSISYYWKFQGYSPKCDYLTGTSAKKYSCFYRNKQGVEVNVQSSKCSGKSKPSVANNSCASYIWMQHNWGSCSKSCGGGSQTRTVNCVVISDSSRPVVPDSVCYTKLGAKPAISQVCNTQACKCSKPTGSIGDVRTVIKTGRHVGSRSDHEWTRTYCFKCTSSLKWKVFKCSKKGSLTWGSSGRHD